MLDFEVIAPPCVLLLLTCSVQIMEKVYFKEKGVARAKAIGCKCCVEFIAFGATSSTEKRSKLFHILQLV